MNTLTAESCCHEAAWTGGWDLAWSSNHWLAPFCSMAAQVAVGRVSGSCLIQMIFFFFTACIKCKMLIMLYLEQNLSIYIFKL